MLEAELSWGSRSRGRPCPDTHQSCDMATRLHQPQLHGLTSAPQHPLLISDGLTEVKRGPYTKSLSSQEEGQGWKPGPQALACLTIFPPHIGLTVRAGWMNPSGGPGTMSQLMSGAINTFAFPTAPTCPSWLPFLLMSGSEASGQDAWVCAENTAWPPLPARPCLGASVHLRFPH